MKQTAVEWLFEKLDVVDSSIMFVHFEQAKEMEKQKQGYSEEDLMEAWHNGMKSDNGFFGSFKQWFEQFKKK